MKSREICIVHISDLHFKEGKYKAVCDALLEDIEEQTRGDENLVFVITGDFVTAGHVKESSSDVVAFFKNF